MVCGWLQQLMMNRKIILAIIVNFLLLVSAACLFILISRSEEENDQTTRVRFIFLLYIHILFFICMIVLTRLEQTYYIILAIFICLLLTATSLYVCELHVDYITRDRTYVYTHFVNQLQKLELTYLNIYFLVYMYSLIGLIPSFLFLLTTEALMCWQEYLINKYKGRCLRKFAYTSDAKYKECSICLAQFNEEEGQNLLEIVVCGHAFHQKCLCQWLRYNSKCPMDRRDIFDFNLEVQ